MNPHLQQTDLIVFTVKTEKKRAIFCLVHYLLHEHNLAGMRGGSDFPGVVMSPQNLFKMSKM